MIVKQGEGRRGVVILDTTKYTEKMYGIIKYRTLQTADTTDPSAATEQKIQKVLRKRKSENRCQNTRDYTQQTQHQLDFTVQPRYTY